MKIQACLKKLSAFIVSLIALLTVVPIAAESDSKGTMPEVSEFHTDFTSLNMLSQLDGDFDAYYYETVENDTSGAAEELDTRWRLQNNRLTIKTPSDGSYFKNMAALTYTKHSYKNFQATYTFSQSSQVFGIMLGTAPGEFAYTGTTTWTSELPYGDIASHGGIVVIIDSEGKIRILGAVENGYQRTTEGIATFGTATDEVKENVAAGKNHTVCITVSDSVLTVVIDGMADNKKTVALTGDYDGGYISLVGNSMWASGGFGSLEIKEFDFSIDFAAIAGGDYAEKLSEHFDAYYFQSLTKASGNGNTGTPVSLASQWKIADNTRLYANTGKYSYSEGLAALTYRDKEYKDFEATFTFSKNGGFRGLMFGTKQGEFAYDTTEPLSSGSYMVSLESRGGVFVSVNDNKIRIYGAVPGGSIYVYDKQDGTSELKDFVNASNKTLHTLKITVSGKRLTGILDGIEASEFVIPLTEDYSGGYISLVESYNQTSGGFGGLTISGSNEKNDYDRDFSAFACATSKTQDIRINGITRSLYPYDFVNSSVLTDFSAYYFADVAENNLAEKQEVEELWKISADNGGMLTNNVNRSNSDANDFKNLTVLTYEAREFTDFEATYTFKQSWNRFGIMFGTRPGEYAYTGTASNNIQSKGGVLVYVEAEGARTAVGAVKGGNYQYFNRTSEGLPGFGETSEEVSANITAGKMHTVKVTVSGSRMKITVDDSEASSVILKLDDSYSGGYVSLVTNVKSTQGGFGSFKISELNDTSEANVPENWELDGAAATEESGLEIAAGGMASAEFAVAYKQKYRLSFTASGQVTATINGLPVSSDITEFYADDLKAAVAFESAEGAQVTDMKLEMIADDVTVRLEREALADRVLITLVTDSEVGALDVKLIFDAGAYEYRLASVNGNISELNKDAEISVDGGSVHIKLEGEHKGEWITLLFDIKDPDSLSERFALSEDSKIKSTGGISNNAYIQQVIYGDANDDTKVDIKDLIRMKKFFADGTLLNQLNSDIGKTGGVTSEDMVQLKQMLLGAGEPHKQSVLYGGTALYLGDSIAYGANDYGDNRLSWGGRIALKYGMYSKTVARSGWTLSTARKEIVTQLDGTDAGKYDYIILQGGVNDIWSGAAEIGAVTPNDQIDGFDTSTIAGALENLFASALKTAPDAKIGYIINYNISDKIGDMSAYAAAARQICEKWNIPYLDLYDNTAFNAEFDKSVCLMADGVHPNPEGYDVLADYIGEWMETL